MPKLTISNEFSHMGGREFIFQKYPKLAKEVKNIILNTFISPKSKISKEKTRQGTLVWSGKDFNQPLETAFKKANWNKKKIILEHGSVEVDFFKERVAIEVQFGKYAFVDTDFSKFEIFHYKNEIDMAIEIVPSPQLRSKMYTGPADFNQVDARIKARGRNNPAVPIWLIGIDCND